MTDQVVCGWHAVLGLLKNPYRCTKKLFISQERHDKRSQELIALAQDKQITIETLSIVKMNQRFAQLTHQGIVAEASPLTDYQENDLPLLLAKCRKSPLIVILDGVTDPHNLGACIRTAEGAGADFIIIPKNNSASITPVVSKIASGAAELLPLVRVTNLARAMTLLKTSGIWLYGAAGETQDLIYQYDFKGPTALVLGAEGKGLRRLTREHCDGLFALPMLGSIESLNVSVAAGVALYEAVRQRCCG